MIQDSKFKILVLIGPTSSGKSELAVKLAKKFNGEIISCDSRQIYRGLDLGTGKIPGKWVQYSPPGTGGVPRAARGGGRSTFLYKSIPHHCIDYINPKRRYSVALFQRDAQKAIQDILSRGKLPILCGGTAHWVDAVVYNQILPDVKPNLKLRGELEKKSVDALFKRLQKLDPARASTIDRHNPRRLIRALEIILTTGKPVPLQFSPPKIGGVDAEGGRGGMIYNTLWLGLNPSQKTLYKKIDLRLKQRLKQGMLKEVKKLREPGGPLLPWRGEMSPQRRQRGDTRGLSWKKLESFGLEYKYISLYLQKKLTYDEMFTQLSYAIKHYSRRQMTCWKRNKDINWLNSKGEARKIIKKFN